MKKSVHINSHPIRGQKGNTHHTGCTGLHKFPSEVLQHIFQYIDSKSLILSVSLVSKQWRTLAYENPLWRNRTLTDEDLRGSNLSLLALAPQLHGINLNTSLSPNLVTEALLHGEKNLRHLTIHFQEGCFSITQLKKLLPHFPNLEHVDLQLPAAPHDQSLFSAFHPLVKLCSLKLTGFVSPVNELIHALTEFCVSVHTLHLVECLISFRDDHLLALVTDRRFWRSLKLITYFISQEAYGYFGHCDHLLQLGLVKCKSLSEEHLLRIARLPRLLELTITENCILSSHALTNFFSCHRMAKLLEVDLTVYRADDQVALAIATNCPHLERLRLAMCLLSDDGVHSIVFNALHLTDLDLEFNNIKGHWLHLIPTHLPRLKRLNLHLCYNVLINLNDLVAHMPMLKIMDPTGAAITGRLVKPSLNRSIL